MKSVKSDDICMRSFLDVFDPPASEHRLQLLASKTCWQQYTEDTPTGHSQATYWHSECQNLPDGLLLVG